MLNEDKIGYVKEVLKPYGENDMGIKIKKNSRPEVSIIIRVSFGISKIFKYE